MRSGGVAIAMLLLSAGVAKADVGFCNRTASKLEFAIAHAVTLPYATHEISGWHAIEAKACAKLMQGSFKGEPVYYTIVYAGGARAWQTKGETTTYSFCVRDKAFVRRGTYKKLQSECPNGWAKRAFYRVVIDFAGDDTLYFFD